MNGPEKASVQDIINGYYRDEERKATVCAECGMAFEDGEIFATGGRYFTAERAATVHMAEMHPDRMASMIASDSRYLSLTGNQKDILRLFSEGLSDGEAARQLGVSPSTVRHQRFMFREKAKAAKAWLALWEMVSGEMERNREAAGSRLLPVHEGAKMMDERYEITEEENRKILRDVFESLDPLKLKVFSVKEKKKIVTLRKIASRFEKGKTYTEKEVNGILADIYDDYVTIRRYLIEYGYLDRTRDGRSYWLV